MKTGADYYFDRSRIDTVTQLTPGPPVRSNSQSGINGVYRLLTRHVAKITNSAAVLADLTGLSSYHAFYTAVRTTKIVSRYKRSEVSDVEQETCAHIPCGCRVPQAKNTAVSLAEMRDLMRWRLNVNADTRLAADGQGRSPQNRMIPTTA